MAASRIMGSSDSYTFLARHYNAMTGYPDRIDAITASIGPWVSEYGIRTALDAGCGGGALLFALRKCGVSPVGLDLSEPMLRLTLENVRARGERFPLHGAPFRSAHVIYPGHFDAVFAMGNALVGHEDDERMEDSLRGLLGSLRLGGLLLAQMLNLTPFFLGLRRLVSHRVVDGTHYWRYAVPDADGLLFSLVVAGPKDSFELHTSRWKRWDHFRMRERLENAGFTGIHVYGDLTRKPFDERRSTDLVIAACRPNP
ncbi:MAG: class I SAM-dependent methyltransferase [Candidatus Zixiibacteriota bacterium]